MKRSIIAALGIFLLLFPPSPDAGIASDQEVKAIARELSCLCGTCPRRPLDECACGWAEKNRGRIAGALREGQDREAIIAGFVREFGQQIFSAPPKEGFNLLAWVMPFLVLGAGGLVVRSVVLAWSRNRERPGASPPQEPTETGEDEDYRTRLEQELKERNA